MKEFFKFIDDDGVRWMQLVYTLKALSVKSNFFQMHCCIGCDFSDNKTVFWKRLMFFLLLLVHVPPPFHFQMVNFPCKQSYFNIFIIYILLFYLY